MTDILSSLVIIPMITAITPTTDLSDIHPQPKLSNVIGNGIKTDNSWKIEESKNFTIVPAYNKGPYMVVNRKDLKTAGRKV